MIRINVLANKIIYNETYKYFPNFNILIMRL